MATKLFYVCECGHMHKNKLVSTKHHEILAEMPEYDETNVFIERWNCEFRRLDTETVIARSGNLVLVRDSAMEDLD